MSSLIDLTKKAKITLEKKGINTSTEKVNVVLSLDISGSMDDMFRRGLVQEVVERILAIGMNMDKDKQIDVYLFGANAHHATIANENNITNYVKNEITSRFRLEGSTNYAGVMKMITSDFVGEIEGLGQSRSRAANLISTPKKGFFSKLFGSKDKVVEESIQEEIVERKEGLSKEATVVFFITDGDNFDQRETEQFVKEVAQYGIFWQFVGIGNGRFSFLSELDEMSGRVIDNANFFQLNDISKISDEELYDRILNEFPSWLREARTKGIIE